MNDNHSEGKLKIAIMIVIMMLMTFMFSITLNMVSPLITMISEQTGWPIGKVGQFNSIIFFLMGAFALIGSPIMDKLGTKKASLIALALAAVGNGMAIFCGNVYALHYLGKVLYGCAWGLFFLIPGAVISYWLPAKTRAIVLGLRCTFDALGAGMSYYIILPVFRAVDENWQMTFMIFGVIFAIIFVLYLFGLNMNDVEKAERAEKAARKASGAKNGSLGLAKATKSPQVWVICIALCGIQFIYNGYSSYLPTYLSIERAFSVDMASNITGMMSIFGIVAGIVMGLVSTSLGRRFVLTWPMIILSVLGGFGCLFMESTVLLIICVGLIGFGMTGFMTGYTTIPGELPGADTDFYNGAVAIIYAVAFMLTYIQSPLVSVIQSHGGSMRTALMVFCIPGIIGLAVSFFIKDTGTKASTASK